MQRISVPAPLATPPPPPPPPIPHTPFREPLEMEPLEAISQTDNDIIEELESVSEANAIVKRKLRMHFVISLYVRLSLTLSLSLALSLSFGFSCRWKIRANFQLGTKK